MKVLLINNFHYLKGGSETVYFNTGNLLKAAGHKVVFFSQMSDRNVPDENDSFFAEMPEGPFGIFKELIYYFNNRNAASKLRQLILKEKPDIAHIHLLWGGLTASVIRVLQENNIPVVHTAHDYRMVCPAYTLVDGEGKICERCSGGYYYRCFINKCAKGNLPQSLVMSSEMYYRNCKWHPCRLFDGVIYVSNFSKRKHEEMDARFRQVKSITLYNCTNVGILDTVVASKCNYFLYYGRLSKEKGLNTLLSVFEKRPDVQLKIVGTGPLEDELRAQSSEYRNIELLGYLSGRELYEKVRNAFFVCVPSVWYENNPMTIVEAYSLGVPVIGSNLGGIPEIVKTGETGYLFEAGNSESLSSVIDNVLEIKEESYQGMRQAAINFASNYFEPNRYIQQLLTFYEEVIESYGSK